jgi:hypothetical protein
LFCEQKTPVRRNLDVIADILAAAEARLAVALAVLEGDDDGKIADAAV